MNLTEYGKRCNRRTIEPPPSLAASTAGSQSLVERSAFVSGERLSGGPLFELEPHRLAVEPAQDLSVSRQVSWTSGNGESFLRALPAQNAFASRE